MCMTSGPYFLATAASAQHESRNGDRGIESRALAQFEFQFAVTGPEGRRHAGREAPPLEVGFGERTTEK
jgi:hypothetical protein